MGRARWTVAVIGIVFLAAAIGPASRVVAHDFGSLSINVYSHLTLEPSRVRHRWVLDMAEVPAAAIVGLIDRDGNGTASQEEQDAYFATWLSSVLAEIHLSLDGDELPETVESAKLELPTGENGALYVRVKVDLVTDLPSPIADGEHRASFEDLNYRDYLGWREVIVTADPGVDLVSSSVATVDRTNELQTYPPDLGASTPNSEAAFSFRIDAAGASDAPSSAPGLGGGGAATDDLPALGLLLLAAAAVAVSVLSGLGGRSRRRPRRGER
jgi:hypothetical protein